MSTSEVSGKPDEMLGGGGVGEGKLLMDWHPIQGGVLLTFNPLHPNISMHIRHTVLNKFPKVLTRRICITIKGFLSW